MILFRSFIAPVAFFLSANALAASEFLRPGQWEMTYQLERDGRHLGKGLSTSRCITAETLEKERTLTFQPFPTGCTGDHRQAGTQIEWTYECAGPPPMKGGGKLTFSKDRYAGESDSFADLKGGKSLRMKHTRITFEAKRTGDCKGTLPAPGKKAPVGPSRPVDPNETRAVVDELGDRVAYVGEREVR